jgi:hypothetical protein
LETVRISGKLSPAPGYSVKIIVRITPPKGDPITKSVVTDSNGVYELSYIPELVGSYSVKASWDGDERFLLSESETIYFSVNPIVYKVVIDSDIKDSAISLKVDADVIRADALPRTYFWEEFTTHTIFLEDFYYVTERTRYRFHRWDDGDARKKREIYVTNDLKLKAIFITQHYLKVTSEFGNPQGEGWYDEGDYAYARLSGAR